jgi:hypothetical protein
MTIDKKSLVNTQEPFTVKIFATEMLSTSLQNDCFIIPFYFQSVPVHSSIFVKTFIRWHVEKFQ